LTLKKKELDENKMATQTQTQAPENLRVVMLLDDVSKLSSHPHIELPSGYYFRDFERVESDPTAWSQIQKSADEFTRANNEVFETEFLSKGLDEVKKRLFFVARKDNDGGEELVATIAAWFDPAWRDGKEWGRIHWVATKQELQGKGIGKPMILEALRRLAAYNHTKVYLVTHTRRHVAIKLYTQFGFYPDLCNEEAIERWRLVPRECLNGLEV
jgi:GNAT superfamily N-acetyltransferase